MPQAGFYPAIPAIERPQNYALDYTDTGIGYKSVNIYKNIYNMLHEDKSRIYLQVEIQDTELNRNTDLQRNY
jgi:hypothetical protein